MKWGRTLWLTLNFTKTSDALGQYVCGRRSEVLQQRRGIYKPQDRTYIFDDRASAEAVREQYRLQFYLFSSEENTFLSRQ